MAKKQSTNTSKAESNGRPVRRRFTKEFKEEAVQMLLDGHTASSVAERLGLSRPGMLSRWKRQLISQAGKASASLELRVRELEQELKRVERERDILTWFSAHFRSTALAIFGRDE